MCEIIRVRQEFTGSENKNDLNIAMVGAINTKTGDCSGSFYLNNVANPTKVAMLIDVTISNITIGAIAPQDGAENLLSLIKQSDYSRILKYKFSTEDELIFNSKIDLKTNKAVNEISGNYPAYLDELIVKNELITMIEPAIMEMFNSKDNCGITYQGRMKFCCGGIIFPVDVTSIYNFRGDRLRNQQSVIFENGLASYDLENKIINEYVNVSIVPKESFKDVECDNQ